jgi:hypothetical protein
MKTILLIYVCIFLLSVPSLFAEDVNKGTSEIPHGTWINEEYKTFGGKYMFNPNGTGFLYRKASDKDPPL